MFLILFKLKLFFLKFVFLRLLFSKIFISILRFFFNSNSIYFHVEYFYSNTINLFFNNIRRRSQIFEKKSLSRFIVSNTIFVFIAITSIIE